MLVTLAALLTSGAGASARVRETFVQVTTTTLHRVPGEFLGLSINDEEMGAYATQPAFPRMVSAIHPYGGPFSLRRLRGGSICRQRA